MSDTWTVTFAARYASTSTPLYRAACTPKAPVEHSMIFAWLTVIAAVSGAWVAATQSLAARTAAAQADAPAKGSGTRK